MTQLGFTEIVGLDIGKQALLLLAVDPQLAGVAMAATAGSGKSTLARGFARLLADGTPFVELPLNVTEDRLIGGLDLETTLLTGKRAIEIGLLAKADRGVLYVDGLNLLDPGVCMHIMDAMARGMVRIEREGLSATYPARFMLIGTYDLSDGNVTRSLLDRIGMIVPFASHGDARARAEIVRRNNGAHDDRLVEEQMLRGLIEMAREQLPRVAIQDEQIEALSRAALTLGVEGNRADVFTIRAALASAALAGRSDVAESDLELAVKLVLVPRATRTPEAAEAEQQEAEQTPSPNGPAPADQADKDSPKDEQDKPTPEQIEQLLMSAVEMDLPADLANLPFAAQRRGKTGSRGVILNNRRGRYARSIAGSLRENKIALLPTLIAAAPWQKIRRQERLEIGDSRLSVEKSPISIRKEDIRVKRFRDKAGMLFVFVVDASGSMALNRMREAKGAATRLLQNAYVHRDQVALIAFRGQSARVLLPPSPSTDRAKRELDVLPTGGGTPLASALLAALQTVKQARSRGIPQATLVLMTDGRANVALRPGEGPASKEQIMQEIHHLSRLIVFDNINAVVIDTQANYLSRGEGRKLAEHLNGRYVCLPNAKAQQIINVVA